MLTDNSIIYNQWDVRFLAVWPCSLDIDPITVSQKVGKEDWTTNLTFYSKGLIEIPSPGADSLRFKNAAFIEINSKIIYQGDEDKLFEHFAIKIENSQQLIAKYMELINAFILRLKYSFSDTQSYMIRLRNIGILDLTMHNLIIGERGIYFRTNLQMAGQDRLSKELIDKSNFKIENVVKREWILLTRAADLINIGFIDEGLIVCFALLDYEVQNFVRQGLTMLTSDETELVLRGIDKNRLQIYLGPLMKIIKNSSPLDDKEIKTDLKWLNSKRNEIMHNGASCTSTESVRALNIVIKILTSLNNLGNNLELPSPKIIF